jgi:hypothetical protein
VILLLKRVIFIDNFIAIELHEATCQKLMTITKKLEKTIKTEFYTEPIYHISLFKISSPIGQETLSRLMEINLENQRSLTLKNCSLKAGLDHLSII